MADTSPPSASAPPPEAAAILDVDELEAARRDPRVAELLADADAYLAQLKREGRDL